MLMELHQSQVGIVVIALQFVTQNGTTEQPNVLKFAEMD